MSEKYQIFISSTYDDLIEERGQVIKACLEMGHIPVGMEMFSAGDEEQWSVIQRQIDEVDYYVVIAAHRYGSMTDGGLSYTEKEYDYAVSKGIPVLGFVIDDTSAWPHEKRDADGDIKLKLLNFKRKIQSKPVNFWIDKGALYGKFCIALMKAIRNSPRSGWVKAVDSADSSSMKELSRLSKENSTLRKENEELKARRVDEDNGFRSVIEILERNKVKTPIWYVSNKAWVDRDPVESTLLVIFESIAPSMLTESDTKDIARSIAVELSEGEKYRHNWPVPSNFVDRWLADFHALELVEPSLKKHSASDTNSYWSLTKRGGEMQASIRKLKLMAGIPEREEVPESE